MPEEARRRDGDDAVVIPLGTGGRPGRGSGKARPSAAAGADRDDDGVVAVATAGFLRHGRPPP